MQRQRAIQLLTEIQAGTCSKEKLLTAIETEHEDFIREHPAMIRAFELAAEAAPEFAQEFNRKVSQLSADSKRKYGTKLSTWPDSVFDQQAAIYQANPIYARLYECFSEMDYQQFTKWIKN